MRDEDLDRVVVLEAQLFSHPWTRGQFENSLSQGDECWLIESTDSIVGYGLLKTGGGEADLLDLGVDPGWQRQGIASRLLDALIDRAATRGADKLFLEVRESSLSARSFYQQAGFEQVGRRRNYYPGDSGREDGLILVFLCNRPCNGGECLD
jgi:ribosomal-protein-alanine N-acetyltransferase